MVSHRYMVGGTPVQLHHVSVVVTAQSHNPSILNPDFLRALEIVPRDWEVAQTISTPAISLVSYENGVTWTVEPEKLEVREHCGPDFDTEYQCHELVTKYIDKLPYVPYRHLGLNCLVSCYQVEANRWLLDRFLVKQIRSLPDLHGLTPTFAFDMPVEDAVCNISLEAGTHSGKESIFAKCNIHHEKTDSADAITQAIGKWSKQLRVIRRTLTRLLGS